MHHLLLLLFFLPAQSASPTTGEIAIFNGEDLSGWEGDLTRWSVEDGAIVGRSTTENPLKRNTCLFWRDEVGDFILDLDYRILSGNSGVQYRSLMTDNMDAGGYQADLEYGPNYSGILYEGEGRGIIATRGMRLAIHEDGTRELLEQFEDAATLQDAVHTEDWNHYQITANGPRLTHKINGQLMVDVQDEDTEHRAERGMIALQLHAGDPMEVQFKNIRLRRLDEAETQGATPQWIWASDPALDKQKCKISKSFNLESKPESAILTITCDNRFKASINGKRVASGNTWQKAVVKRVEKFLVPGLNTLEIECENETGPAALAARLHIEIESADVVEIVTDTSWIVDDDQGHRSVSSYGISTAPRGPWPDPFVDRKPIQPTSISVPDGFRVELLYPSAPGEGSWVNMCFDPEGRIVVAREEGGLIRLDLRSGNIHSEFLDLFKGAAHGLLFAHGGLYVNVSTSSREHGGLYFFTDTDEDDHLDHARKILTHHGGGEHGAHAVVLGPDDCIYLMHGNMVSLPTRLSERSPHRGYAEDLLLPREWDPNGHAAGTIAPGANVLRLDRDGNIEMVAAGMRNPFDLAFNPDGELFTYDADMEWDIGLPWYRPTRIVHVVSAGDYGWRSGSGKWPTHYPDSLPAAIDIGLGSPTGIAFATHARFPAPWKGALFLGDWSLGRILAAHLTEQGSSYGGDFDLFAEGKPLNVTDLVFGDDGALYFITGGRGTESGLYRVTYEGDIRPPEKETLQETLAARETRKTLEALHRDGGAESMDVVWGHLRNTDRFIRYAARVALERTEPELWKERLQTEEDLDTVLAATVAAIHTNTVGSDEIASLATGHPFEDLGLRQQLEEVRLFSLGFSRLGPPADETRDLLARRYQTAFPTGHPVLDREVLSLLVYLATDDSVGLALDRMEKGPSSNERMFAAFLLRAHVPDFNAEEKERYVQYLLDAEEAEGGVSYQGYLNLMREQLPFTDRERSSKKIDLNAERLEGDSHNWTVATVLPSLEDVNRGRSFKAGRAAYESTLCVRCHRFDGRGGNGVAPDLTSASGRFSREDLLEALLEPSKIISDQYRDTQFTLADGSLEVGRLLKEDGKNIVLRKDPLTNARRTIARRQVVSRTPSPVSPMPPGLVDRLSLPQLLDLLAYIESGGDPQHPFFKSP